jgi:hypothetical protein
MLGPQILRPRPDSYWTASVNPLEAMLRDMKGRRRREMVRDLYAAGKLEGLSNILLSNSLDDEARKRLGLIHPTFMGGEYLPDYGRHETEIVRIELESTTYDVISLRARPVGSRFGYRVVDEYESEFILPQRTSRRPFSLCQLLRFLDSVQQVETGDPSWDRFGFVLSFNQCNLECGAGLEDLQNFTQVYSDQYPDLALHYSRKIAQWYAAREQTDRTNQTRTMEELKTNERS